MRHGRRSQVFTRLAHTIIAFVFTSAIASAQNNGAGVKPYVPKLERILNDNIAAFWLAKSLDQKNGGYVINFGHRTSRKARGEMTSEGAAGLVSQECRGGLRAAGKGISPRDLAPFPQREMWTQERRLYWEWIRPATKAETGKHLYVAFELYALSEYYIASRRKMCLLRRSIFELLEAKSQTSVRRYVEDQRGLEDHRSNEASYMGVLRLQVDETRTCIARSLTHATARANRTWRDARQLITRE